MAISMARQAKACTGDAGAAETAGQVGRWVEHQVCHPAAALALGTMLWAVVHPASFHIVKCLAAAIPVQAGYASTVRQTARGQLTQGTCQASAAPCIKQSRSACTRCCPAAYSYADAAQQAVWWHVSMQGSVCMHGALDAAQSFVMWSCRHHRPECILSRHSY